LHIARLLFAKIINTSDVTLHTRINYFLLINYVSYLKEVSMKICRSRCHLYFTKCADFLLWPILKSMKLYLRFMQWPIGL